MFILDQITVPRIFGGEKLLPYGADASKGEKIGQLFTVSATKDLDSTVMNGPFAGEKLSKVFAEHKELFGYDRYGDIFPIMIDFIDSSSGALCFQTHPTKEYAGRELGMPFGKNESWYYIDAPASGANYANTPCETKEQALQALERKDYDAFIGTVPIADGDYLYIPAATPHALSEGALVFEIQQAHPKTFNFYDFDRLYDGKKRALNLDDGFENFNFSASISARPMAPGELFEEEDYSSLLTKISSPWKNEQPTFCALTLLEGSLNSPEGELKKGMSALVMPGEEVCFAGEAMVMVNWPK